MARDHRSPCVSTRNVFLCLRPINKLKRRRYVKIEAQGVYKTSMMITFYVAKMLRSSQLSPHRSNKLVHLLFALTRLVKPNCSGYLKLGVSGLIAIVMVYYGRLIGIESPLEFSNRP